MRMPHRIKDSAISFHSLSVGHGMRCDVTMKERVCHSLAVGHGRCDESA
jgi:hypothetical protein